MTDRKRYTAHVRKSDKERQYVHEHLIGVSEKAGRRAAKIEMEAFGQLIGILHDLGKCTEEFARYIESAAGLADPDTDDHVDAVSLKGKIDHSTAGAQLALKSLSAGLKGGEIIGSIAALCLASHHSGLIDCIEPDGTDVLSRRLAKAENLTRLSEAEQKIDTAVREKVKDLAADRTWLVASLKKLLSVQSANSELVSNFNVGLLVRFLFGCLTDADGRDTADFENPATAQKRQNGRYVPWVILAKRLEHAINSFHIRYPVDQVRADVSNQCLSRASSPKGIFTLTVPTGGGKTLASLRFALNHAMHHKMDRIFYFVPFTTIIDQNAKVVRQILEPDGGPDSGMVVLESHSNLLPERRTWLNKILTEDWDAPVVFTTTVQLLEALFSGGSQAPRRMHQLAYSVLIFDEVQALPIRVTHLFCNAMNFLTRHCGSSLLLCTATQPLLNLVDEDKGRIELKPESEIVSDVKSLFAELKRVELFDLRRPEGWSAAEVGALVDDEMARSGDCLVVVNTRKSAQALYAECAERHSEAIYHLSAGMCPAHRAVVLNAIRARLDEDDPVLCVSTQVIEAGVDIDFRSVIRHAAGLGSIAQSAGRCNRNGKRRSKGRVLVLNPSDENLDMLHDIREGREQAIRLMDEFRREPMRFDHDVIGPKAMETYFEYYFFNRASIMDYPLSRKDKNSIGRDDTLLSLLASNQASVGEFVRQNGQNYPRLLRQSFMSAANAFSAIDAPTRGVIVQYGERGKQLVGELSSAFEVEKQFALLRECQQYSVNLYPHQLKQLENEGALHEVQEVTGILYVDTEYYSDKFGLSVVAVGPQDPMIA